MQAVGQGHYVACTFSFFVLNLTFLTKQTGRLLQEAPNFGVSCGHAYSNDFLSRTFNGALRLALRKLLIVFHYSF